MAASKGGLWAFLVAMSFFLLLFSPLPISPDVTSTEDVAREGAKVWAAAANYTYRDYWQVRSVLLQIELQHLAIAKVYDIGDSWEKTQSIADRDILALKISDNVTADEDEPEVLVTALHHAREWITTETAVALAERLTGDYGADPQVSWLVDNREVWIVPIVNPDGLDYSLSSDSMWRKNRRLNADLTYGVDLNRNYDGASNGDPLGDWGGAGSSSITSSEIYRGTAPFSEPETQAIRDLILARNFTIGLDFHSYGNLVLWPWGYTTNHSAAYNDFSRIGSELAAVNGYVSEQSIGLYPTTGDSLDWMYGYAGIYAFTFEVGNEFHPANASVVAESVSVNVAASVLGIEIAGDREERALSILHTPMNTANYTDAGYTFIANVTAERGVNVSTVMLFYSLDGHNWTSVSMVKSGENDTYAAHVPSAAVWHAVDYYFTARDLNGVRAVAPEYAPYWMYSLLIFPPQRLIGGVDFYIPPVIDGTVGYQFNASIMDDYPEFMAIELLLLGESNSSHGWGLENGTGYRICTVPPGIALDNYSARLMVTVGGFQVWNSSAFKLEVGDFTDPEISQVQANLFNTSEGRLIVINVDCSDLYGVQSVTIEYRMNGDQARSVIMNRSDSRFNPDSWTVSLPLPDEEGYLEYRVSVSDSRNTASLPDDQYWILVAFGSLESDDAWVVFALLGVIAALVVAAVVHIVIRARRQ